MSDSPAVEVKVRAFSQRDEIPAAFAVEQQHGLSRAERVGVPWMTNGHVSPPAAVGLARNRIAPRGRAARYGPGGNMSGLSRL